MKNIKLLLATTAMLSVVAAGIDVKASDLYTDDGITIPIKVSLMSGITVSVLPLEFGVAMVKPGDTIDVTTGNEITTTGIMLKKGDRGYVMLNDNSNFPSNLSLVLPDNEHPVVLKSGTVTCGSVSNFSQELNDKDAGGENNEGFWIGGTFTVDSKFSDTEFMEAVNCTGEMVATLVFK